MSGSPLGQYAFRVWWCGVASVFCFPAGASELDGRIDRHVAAGEFGRALELAHSVPRAAQRDELLQRIASAQAASGAQSAALATAHDIRDDLVRHGAYRQIGSETFRPGGSPAPGARGGVTIDDFNELIDLITSTVDPTSWVDNGGAGTISPFVGGVYVDSQGLLARAPDGAGEALSALRLQTQFGRTSGAARTASRLRKISLSRLERAIQARRAAGRELDEEMQFLAGLFRVQYVFVYPDSRDVVLAGPAGDWGFNPEGRVVHLDSGAPVLRLDDLLVVLQNAWAEDQGRFGCSITPVAERLAAVRAFCEESSRQPIKPYQRETWLAELRALLGRQKIEVFGLDPRCHAARVLVEADYHMKLVGLGLADGTLGVVNYLDSIELAADGTLPPVDVLRWWFTLNYEAVHTTADRRAYQWRGPAVQVRGENELLSAQGERVPTGRAQEPNARFAQSFTKHFDQLAVKYPVYSELRNIFDLAVVAAILRAEELPRQAGWQLPYFRELPSDAVALGEAPREVESVISHRLIADKHVVAAVSGGVSVDARPLAQRAAIVVDRYGLLDASRETATPPELPRYSWWWD